MLKQQKQSKSGFTIIEVVLVLAIAGLIFLMVFLALPALQRSQRDTQRRDDLARFQTAIANYQTNNRGKIPGNNVASGANQGDYRNKYTEFLVNYLWAGGDEFTDPDGQVYAIASVCPNLGNPGASGNVCVSLDEVTPTEGATVNTWEYDGDRNNLQDNLENIAAPDGYSGTLNHYIYVFQNAQCDGEKVVPSTGVRKIAIQFKLEGGGIYCGNN
ncbi:type II secretion system protein [Candidatus Saccharibacteria bacterium]|nr:type II secretion system protein [Candidatus Saccharibacteria bacterium]